MSAELGDLLVEAGLLRPDQLTEALAAQRNRGLPLGETLVRLGFLDETNLVRFQARQQGLPFVDLSKGKIGEGVLQRVPAAMALDHGIVPVIERAGTLVVAIDDPQKRVLADQLSFALGCDVACALAAPSALKAALARYYGAALEEPAPARASGGAEEDSSDAPVVRLVNRLFHDALAARASDIHLEPMGGRLVVRLRVDGVLREHAEHPLHLAAPLVSRLKIMGSMDIAEKRKPQDGRIEIELNGRQIDVRASILPSNHGETMVLRLLDRSRNLLSLSDLGFDGELRQRFERLITRPHGIVLVTGPTGSGKTTTLYAALCALNRPDVKIITAEDPVEYHIAGINQVQVHQKIGLSFARILKAMLRAAPNIILVGEIRDLETAEVAIQAALTGHLVFSTLHTNDAASALTRLADMGVAPFLVSTAVQAVLAQRLVRRLCKDCRRARPATLRELQALGLDSRAHAGAQVYQAQGCKVCDGQGFHGRVGLFELLELDHTLRELVFGGASLEAVRQQALGSGALNTLLSDGARKVLQGDTTISELTRVTRLACDPDEDATSASSPA